MNLKIIDNFCLIVQSWVNILCSCLKSLQASLPFLCVDQNTEIASGIKYQDSEEPIGLVKTLIILKNVFNGIFICI